MSSEVSAARFVELVGRSGLVPAERLPRILSELGYDGSSFGTSASARELADRLVERGILTHFQAAKLLRGRWIGLVVGSYRVLTPLGRGGMGMVFLAQGQRSVSHSPAAGEDGGNASGWDGLVALKILPPQLARKEPRMQDRFEREERYYRRVRHPRIVQMLEAGEEHGIRYIALEFVPGRSLQELVSRWGRLEPERAIPLFAEVAEGLQHLHEQNLIHRDVKPANIMVTPQGAAKLLDLGLAIATDEPPPQDIRIAGGKGYIVGTMDYIAPEQARHATAIDHRADLYALGCTLYFALTGTPPFPGGSKRDKIRWQRYAEPIFIRDLNPVVPSALADLVHRLLAKNPGQRPNSAWQVREELLALTQSMPSAVALPAWSAQETVELFDTDTVGTDWWEDASEPVSPTHPASTPNTGEWNGAPAIQPPPLPPHARQPSMPQSQSPLVWTLLVSLGLLLLAAVVILLRSL
jgi:serine/threonine protein kinase